MDHLLVFSFNVLLGFFAIMNPIGNAPIFVGLVDGLTPDEQRSVARKSIITAFLIIAVFSIFGHLIFKVFGITLPAFQIAGGVLVYLVGYQLLQGKQSPIHHFQSGQDKPAVDPDDIAITPIAIPILAGPGTITTAINFTGSRTSYLHTGIVLFVFAVICIATYLAFVYSEKLISFIKPGIIKVITRLMGLIITVIAVQMIIEGVQNAIKLYK